MWMYHIFCTTYFNINTTTDFLNISNNQADVYLLNADLSFTNIAFRPQQISGIFLGGAHSITNVTINTSYEETTSGVTRQFYGIFGRVTGTLTVSDVTIIDVNIMINRPGPLSTEILYAGGLVAYGAVNATNVNVKNLKITSLGSQNFRIFGGLVGRAMSLNASTCSVANFQVDARHASTDAAAGFAMGGLVGFAGRLNASITQSQIMATIDADFHLVAIGGVAGRTVEPSYVSESISDAVVHTLTTQAQIGGTVGAADGSVTVTRVVSSLQTITSYDCAFGITATGSVQASYVLNKVQFTVNDALQPIVAPYPVGSGDCLQCQAVPYGTQAVNPSSAYGTQSPQYIVNSVPTVMNPPISTQFDVNTSVICSTAGMQCGTFAVCDIHTVGVIQYYTCGCADGYYVIDGSCTKSGCVSGNLICGGALDLCYNDSCSLPGNRVVPKPNYTGLIVGVVVGSVAFVAAGIIAAFWIYKCRYNKRNQVLTAAKKDPSTIIYTDVSDVKSMKSLKSSKKLKSIKHTLSGSKTKSMKKTKLEKSAEKENGEKTKESAPAEAELALSNTMKKKSIISELTRPDSAMTKDLHKKEEKTTVKGIIKDAKNEFDLALSGSTK